MICHQSSKSEWGVQFGGTTFWWASVQVKGSAAPLDAFQSQDVVRWKREGVAGDRPPEAVGSPNSGGVSATGRSAYDRTACRGPYHPSGDGGHWEGPRPQGLPVS